MGFAAANHGKQVLRCCRASVAAFGGFSWVLRWIGVWGFFRFVGVRTWIANRGGEGGVGVRGVSAGVGLMVSPASGLGS